MHCNRADTFTMMRKILAVLSVVLCSCAVAVSQIPSQDTQLRVQIWAELDAITGSFEEESSAEEGLPAAKPAESARQDSRLESAKGGTLDEVASAVAHDQALKRLPIYSYAIERSKAIAPFFMAGMISGWSFDYVPFDKTRRVTEVFEWSEDVPFDQNVNPVTYKAPVVQDDRLLCWAYCDRTPVQQLEFRRWKSVNLPKVQGKGSAPVENGFDGIKEACANAIKDAVRTYWRIYEKNKPKEILGTVLLIGEPRVYIYEGQYVADLEFFLETDRIVRYTYY